MSSLCPKCGKFMEGDVCEKCQAEAERELYYKQKKKKAIITKVVILAVAVLLITVLIKVGSGYFKEMEDIRNAKKSYSVLMEFYEEGDFDSALDRMENGYNHLNRGVDKDTDAKVDKLYSDIEETLYKVIKENGAYKSEFSKLYLQYYPEGKYLSQIQGHKTTQQQTTEKKVKKEPDSVVITPNSNNYSKKQEPEKKQTSTTVAVSNAIIVEDNHENMVIYKKKCDTCGYVDSSTTRITPGSFTGGFYCPTCKENKVIKIQTTYSY